MSEANLKTISEANRKTISEANLKTISEANLKTISDGRVLLSWMDRPSPSLTSRNLTNPTPHSTLRVPQLGDTRATSGPGGGQRKASGSRREGGAWRGEEGETQGP